MHEEHSHQQQPHDTLSRQQWRKASPTTVCRESVAINSSLMTLGRCLEALRWNQQHRLQDPRLVPYRESKVTCGRGCIYVVKVRALVLGWLWGLGVPVKL